MSAVTDLQTYLFDLRGYVKLEGALSAEEVAELNAALKPFRASSRALACTGELVFAASSRVAA